MGLCNRTKERVCAKKRKGILLIKREKKGDTSICGGLTAKRVHSAIKVATYFTSTLYSKER